MFFCDYKSKTKKDTMLAYRTFFKESTFHCDLKAKKDMSLKPFSR